MQTVNDTFLVLPVPLVPPCVADHPAGFKEMYCDVDPEGKLAKPDEGKALGPPRQQVFEALAEVLSKHQVNNSTAACMPVLHARCTLEQRSWLLVQNSSLTHAHKPSC